MPAPHFFPTLTSSDVERASQLIYQAYYAPANQQTLGDNQNRIQQELFEIQKRQEAWGLVVPFLESQDQNVQFFGAHTAQVKIARDWDSIPPSSVMQLRDLILELAGRSVALGRSKVILRKLFVALTSLALKLVPGHPTRWPDWILSCVTCLSGHGSAPENILDFLTIVAEEVETADLLGSSKMQMQQSLMDAIPMVVQAITTIIQQQTNRVSTQQLTSAVKCFEAWVSILPSSDLTPIIPHLISLLGPSTDDAFIAASDALQDVMSKSALSDGSGSKTLTDPLLNWLDQWGDSILKQPLGDPVPHSLCKLLAALGDHSTSYFAVHLASPVLATGGKTRGHLTHTFLRLILAFTGAEGYYGEDEEESEMTLGFWYLFQEALWNADYYFDTEAEGGEQEVDSDRPWGKDQEEKEKERMDIAKGVYSELVQVLRRKVKFPPNDVTATWSKDQMEKFQVYRRDVGDTLLNAYYVLRTDMLAYCVNDLAQRLSQQHHEWEEIEANVHCIMSVQEGIPLEENIYMSRLFSSEILGRLPTAGPYRVRRTTLGLIGTYASWFTTQSKDVNGQPLLMNAITYVVNALSEPVLCLSAANALQELCDSNRAALAPHISAFAELHAGLSSIPDTEKSKVLQSISSVIQALPPDEEIAPIEAIVNPVVNKMHEAILFAPQLPDEARNLVILQLTTLSGVSKGLTRSTDALQILEEDDTSEAAQREAANLKQAREDPRMVLIREKILDNVRRSIDLWSADAGVSNALSEFFKAITALPSDITLLSLPAGPLLELVCVAIQRHLNAVWLSLAGILIMQLNPPTLFPTTFKSTGPDVQTYALVGNVLPVILQSALGFLSAPGAMVENPDVVQDFFGCMDTVAKNFLPVFYRLPPGAFDALMQCAISSLSLQERYSLVAACNFLGSLISRTFAVASSSTPSSSGLSAPSEHNDPGELPPSTFNILIQAHGRAILRSVLAGFAGVAPRSSSPNLIELLAVMLSKCGDECKIWIREILFSDDFVQSRATLEAKEKFYKALMGSRQIRRTREAAQQFSLVARGLEGTSFGYSSIM